MCGCPAHRYSPGVPTPLCTCKCDVHKNLPQACDACVMTRQVCPGIPAHCAAGQHCIDNDSVCSMDYSRDDHGPECCSCKKNMRRDPKRKRSA